MPGTRTIATVAGLILVAGGVRGLVWPHSRTVLMGAWPRYAPSPSVVTLSADNTRIWGGVSLAGGVALLSFALFSRSRVAADPTAEKQPSPRRNATPAAARHVACRDPHAPAAGPVEILLALDEHGAVLRWVVRHRGGNVARGAPPGSPPEMSSEMAASRRAIRASEFEEIWTQAGSPPGR